MNRNSVSRFGTNPVNIDIPRSKFKMPSQHKTTFNTGDLIPVETWEILPGDTFDITMSSAIRMTTPIYPVMDNANIDTYFFFVPARLLWEHWKEFNGENTSTHWEQTVEYQVPQLRAPQGGWEKGTIADYLGIPTKVENIEVNALPFRAYCLIWNEWFRDENLKDPAMVNKDETTLTGTNSGDYVINAQKGAKPLKAAKYADYFTTALPAPQKGPSVLLPLGEKAPVVTDAERHNVRGTAMIWERMDGQVLGNGVVGYTKNANNEKESFAIHQNMTGWSGNTNYIEPNNLWADLKVATAATINELRQAFAVQKLLERDARGGTRYTEMIRSHFGVTSPDARQQRPEYLGGYRQPINIDQVIQTSATDSTSPQGNTAAFSLTNNVEHIATHSFTEHGYVMALAVVRTEHTYQQGINKMFSRKNRFDFFYPALSNIGEVAILNKEVYAQGTSADEEAFGYQEAWGEYRYKPSRVSGAFRSNYQTSLDSWHYADYYESQPYLSGTWIDETEANMDRTLTVNHTVEDQFIGDFYFAVTAVRPMPLYSVPGLIDHH